MSLPRSLIRNPRLDAWLRIGSDGRVGVYTGKVEIGQGIKTALAVIAAEELDVAFERIDVHTADTARGPNEGITAGSGSVEQSGSALRHVAAQARRHMLELAAEALGAHIDQLQVVDGRVRAPGVAHETSYWELMGDKEFKLDASEDVRPKLPERYTLVGRPARRIGLAEIAAGTARFAQDFERPGLAYGRVVRPPRAGARLASIDAGEVAARDGVLAVVRDGSFLGVVAEREEQAIEAARLLRECARWDGGADLGEFDQLFERLTSEPHVSRLVVDGTPQEGDVPPIDPPDSAQTTLRARYCRPYHMHAALGPSAATAEWRDGQLTVWSHTQGPELLRPSLAQALGMESDAIRVAHVEGPGCYGHNGADDAAFDAALLARAVPGRPVRLQWMREDEHGWEPYGPAMVVEIQASLDASGGVVDWNHDVYSDTHMGRPLPWGEFSGLLAAWYRDPPMQRPPKRPAGGFHSGSHRNADPLYSFARRRVVKHLVPGMPLRTSSTRGLGAFANVFAIESAMDELAHAAGVDPLAFRLRRLDDARARAVLEAAAETSGWAGSRAGGGRGRGVAFARYENYKVYVAVVMEVEVDAEGAIHLERGVIAADAGQIIDPDGLANQLEGGLIQAASWTLLEQVRFDHRRVTSLDWDGYPILRFPEVPELETVLLDHPELPCMGAGEGTQGPTPAAIANAVFDATGLRLREIPFTPERVRAARG